MPDIDYSIKSQLPETVDSKNNYTVDYGVLDISQAIEVSVVQGVLIDDLKNPLAGAKVSLSILPDSKGISSDTYSGSAVSDKTGAFSIKTNIKAGTKYLSDIKVEA